MEATVLIPLITGGAGLLGAIIGGSISAYVTTRNQTRADQADRRRQAALILGQQRAFVDDLAPDQWAFNAGPQSGDVFDEQRAAWRALRPQVLMLHPLYPDHSDSIEEMYTTTENLMVEIARLVKTTLTAEDGLLEIRNKAISSQKRARELTNALMEHVGRA